MEALAKVPLSSLVYYESFDDVNKAIDREKQLKRWNRTKKVWLIERRNPPWEDLAAEWFTRHMYQPDQQVLHSPVDCFADQLTRSG